MVTPAPDPGEDPQLQALTTLAGWRQFASAIPAVPELLDSTVWQDLAADKRAAYDDDRIAHHSRLLIVQTPAVRDVVTTGRRAGPPEQVRVLRQVRADRLRPRPDRQDYRHHPARQDHRGVPSPAQHPLRR